MLKKRECVRAYLIFACGLVFISFITTVAQKLNEKDSRPIHKRFLRLLQFVKVAPILAFLILVILVFTTLHTKPSIRLSHAWFVAQFWAYTPLMFALYKVTKIKLSMAFSVLSFLIAIYTTPLFHYEHLFVGLNIMVSVIIGLVMFLSMWLTVSKVNKRLRP